MLLEVNLASGISALHLAVQTALLARKNTAASTPNRIRPMIALMPSMTTSNTLSSGKG